MEEGIKEDKGRRTKEDDVGLRRRDVGLILILILILSCPSVSFFSLSSCSVLF
jgi:hypothetical protein